MVPQRHVVHLAPSGDLAIGPTPHPFEEVESETSSSEFQRRPFSSAFCLGDVLSQHPTSTLHMLST